MNAVKETRLFLFETNLRTEICPLVSTFAGAIRALLDDMRYNSYYETS
jgi:hypothetical protein